MTEDVEYITIATLTGPRQVMARPTEDPELWVHYGSDKKDGWTVTHRKTGQVVARGIKTRTEACDFVAETMKLGIDWSIVEEASDIPTDKRRAVKSMRKKYIGQTP